MVPSTQLNQRIDALTQRGGNHFAVTRQQTLLREAIAASPDALLTFAKRQQEARDERAARDLHCYAVVRRDGQPAGVRTADHLYYLAWSPENIPLFPDCPDQQFIDALNLALREAGIGYRVTTKHYTVLWMLLGKEDGQ